MNNLSNQSALASTMSEVINATKELNGATARFTLALAHFIVEGGEVLLGSGKGAPVLAYLETRHKLNKDGKRVEDNSHKTAIWFAMLCGPLGYSEDRAKALTSAKAKSVDQKTNNTMKSAFVRALRPAAYIASRDGLLAVTVNDDGAFTGVPVSEVIDLFDDSGALTKAAQERVQRVTETEESEGREITPDAALAKVQKTPVATIGKAGIPTTSDTLKRWTQDAIEAGVVPPPGGRERNRTVDDKADDAINYLHAAFVMMKKGEESPFALTDERDAKLRALAAFITATLN